LLKTGEKKGVSAIKAGMDENTARRYVKAGKLPSEMKQEYVWRTREDPNSLFKDVPKESSLSSWAKVEPETTKNL